MPNGASPSPSSSERSTPTCATRAASCSSPRIRCSCARLNAARSSTPSTRAAAACSNAAVNTPIASSVLPALLLSWPIVTSASASTDRAPASPPPPRPPPPPPRRRPPPPRPVQRLAVLASHHQRDRVRRHRPRQVPGRRVVRRLVHRLPGDRERLGEPVPVLALQLVVR